MRKILLPFLLCFSLLFLIGCTVVKRRYTAGYSVTWHSKTSATKSIQQINPLSNKIAESHSSASQYISLKTDNPAGERITLPITYSHSEKVTQKIISNYLPPPIGLPYDSLTFDDTTDYVKPSRMASPAFGFLSMLSGVLSYILVEILSIGGYAGLFLLLPISALFFTILFAYLAIHKARILLTDYHLHKDKAWSIVGIVLASIGLLIGLLGLIGTIILLGVS